MNDSFKKNKQKFQLNNPIRQTMPNYLPKALFLFGGAAVFNFVQTIIPTMRDLFIPKMFSGPSGSEATPFAARMFGHWTLLSAIIRIMTSYNVKSKP